MKTRIRILLVRRWERLFLEAVLLLSGQIIFVGAQGGLARLEKLPPPSSPSCTPSPPAPLLSSIAFLTLLACSSSSSSSFFVPLLATLRELHSKTLANGRRTRVWVQSGTGRVPARRRGIKKVTDLQEDASDWLFKWWTITGYCPQSCVAFYVMHVHRQSV